MLEPSGQPDSGLASKTLARHAFWIVVSRDGSAIGRATLVLAICSTPRPVDSTFTVRAAPSALLVLASVSAVNTGLKGIEQLPTCMFEFSDELLASSPVSTRVVYRGLHVQM